MYEDASLDDLATILKGTIIQYDKEPVIVKMLEDVAGHRKAVIKFLIAVPDQEEKEKIVNLDDPKLDSTPVPLGLCNHGGATFYTCRKPIRQFSQGLSQNSFIVADHTNSNKNNALKEIMAFKAKGLYNCIKGVYPSLKEALEILNKEENKVFSMAFSRLFSVDENHSLYYKMEKVGMINPDNGKLLFQKNRTYLKEIINA